MLPYHGTLSLSRTLADADEVVLVSSTAWCAVRAEGGYHEIDSRKAIWMLENLDRHRAMEVRSFAAQLGRFDLYRMDDHEVLRLIRDAIRDGRVIAVRKGAEKSASPSATVQLRHLLAQVEKQIRGRLSYRGRQYKLVVDVELAQLPDRDYYEVASQIEARAVLDSAAKDLGAPADILKQASDKLSNDWRPPFSQPKGLVLLRRIPARASAPTDIGPALTPSQMHKLKDGWIEIELVEDADADEPRIGTLKLTLADGGERSVTLSEGFVRLEGIKEGNVIVKAPATQGET
jgi:hypothetical protein